MANHKIVGNVLEELKRELNRPVKRGYEMEKGSSKSSDDGAMVLPCADMTCPCRIIKK
jgi:hypothetical protein